MVPVYFKLSGNPHRMTQNVTVSIGSHLVLCRFLSIILVGISSEVLGLYIYFGWLTYNFLSGDDGNRLFLHQNSLYVICKCFPLLFMILPFIQTWKETDNVCNFKFISLLVMPGSTILLLL